MLCYAMLCYAMLCYAMFIEQKSEPGRKRSAATQERRSKMNARRPQEIKHERQKAPAGPKLSARRLQEASQNELTQKPLGARGLSASARSRRELSGAARSLENRALRAAFMIPPPTVGPLWGLEIEPKLRSWRETSGEH